MPTSPRPDSVPMLSTQRLRGKTFERSTPVGPWARTPPRYLAEGSRLTTRVEGVGEQRNALVKGS